MNEIEITSCHQMTFNDYLSIKDEIRKRINRMAEDYIYIGYQFRRLEETKAYLQEGYKTLTEFAKREYGFSESTVSKLKKANETFSVGGYSPNLIEDFTKYNINQLFEISTLPQEDWSLVHAGTTVTKIREIKHHNKDGEQFVNEETVQADILAPAESVNSAESQELQPLSISQDLTELQKVIIEFFRNEKDLLNSIYELGDVESIADRINPSGNRTFRKGLHLLLMYPYLEGVALKTMGKPNETYTWQQFVEIIVSVYAATYTKPGRVHQDFYGEEKKEPPKVAESIKKPRAAAEKPVSISKLEPKTVQAQGKTSPPADSEPEKEEQLPGQVEIEEYFDEQGDYHVPEDTSEAECEPEEESTEEITVEESVVTENIEEQDTEDEEEPELLTGLFKHGDNIEFWLEGVKETSGKSFDEIREDLMYCLETRLELGYMIEMAFREE